MDRNELFSLRWNNFHSFISSGFHSLFEEDILLDVTLAAGGKFLQAHKFVLALCSPYFKEIFKVNPCQHPVIILKDVGSKEIEAILEFMYKGEVSVAQNDLPSFLKTAETLQISGLTGSQNKKSSASNECSQIALPSQSTSQVTFDSPCSPVPAKRFRQDTNITPDSFEESANSPSGFKRFRSNLGAPVAQESLTKELQCSELVSNSAVKQEPVPIEISDDEGECADGGPVEEEDHKMENNSLVNTTLHSFEGPGSSFDSSSGGNFDSPQPPSLLESSFPQENLQGNVRYVISKKRQQQLVHCGYIYARHQILQNKIIWMCTQYRNTKCKARFITSKDGCPFIVKNLHNHPQPSDEIRRKEENWKFVSGLTDC